jgi:hypothetical protein
MALRVAMAAWPSWVAGPDRLVLPSTRTHSAAPAHRHVDDLGNAGGADRLTVCVARSARGGANCGILAALPLVVWRIGMRRLSTRFLAAALLLATGAQAEPIIGITGADAGANLVRFDARSPSVVTTIGPLTGIVAGHSVRAIDRRPANDTIYVLSTNASNGFQLYTLNPVNAALTPVGSGGTVSFTWPVRVSMDFNPAVDRLRVVTGTAQNLRLNPNDGTLVGEDVALAYVPGDPNAAANPPFPVGVAYDFNDNDPATSTTMYVYDFDTDAIGRVGSVGGSPVSPNSGQITTIFTPPDFITNDGGVGFDVSVTGNAYLSYAPIVETGISGGRSPEAVQPLGVVSERFARVNLATGALTVVGDLPVNLLDFTALTGLPQAQPVPALDRYGVLLLGALFVLAGLLAVRRLG